MDKIIKEYQKPRAYKYGLKIESPFVADFSRVHVEAIGRRTAARRVDRIGADGVAAEGETVVDFDVSEGSQRGREHEPGGELMAFVHWLLVVGSGRESPVTRL